MLLTKQPPLASLSPFARILFAFLLMITCFALSFLLAALLAVPIFGAGFSDITAALGDFDDPETLRLLQYFQVVQSLGLFIIPPLLAGFLFDGNAFRFLQAGQVPRFAVLGLTLVLMVLSLPFVNWLIGVNESMTLPAALQPLEEWIRSAEENAARLTELFMQMPTFSSFLFNLLMIAVLPAIGEELVFRGLLQRLFRDWLGNPHAAILLASVLFSAMHMQFYGFLPRLVLGLILGYLFWVSGSLWVPVLAHFIQNGTVVVVAWMSGNGWITADPEQFGTTGNGWIIAASAAGTLLLVIMVSRFRKRDTEPPNMDL